MSDYRTVKRPTSLVAKDVAAEDQDVFEAGVDAAIGTDLPVDRGATQLNIRFRKGNTFVEVTDGPWGTRRWMLAGLISPQDCRTHYLSKDF